MQFPQSPRNQASSFGSSFSSSQDAHTRDTHKKPWQTLDSVSGNSSRMPPCSLPGAFSHITHDSQFSWLLTLAPSLLVSQGGAGNSAPDSWHRPKTLWSKTQTSPLSSKHWCVSKKKTGATWPGVQRGQWWSLVPYPSNPIHFFHVFVLILCSSSNNWYWLGLSNGFSHWKEVTRENNHLLSQLLHLLLQINQLPIWFQQESNQTLGIMCMTPEPGCLSLNPSSTLTSSEVKNPWILPFPCYRTSGRTSSLWGTFCFLICKVGIIVELTS